MMCAPSRAAISSVRSELRVSGFATWPLCILRPKQAWIVAHVADGQREAGGRHVTRSPLADRDREILFVLKRKPDSDPATEQSGRFVQKKKTHGRDSGDRGGLGGDGLEALGDVDGGGEDLAGI
jgi:hypothetical protein